MKFYYTTSQGEDFEQKQAILSLGGYKSSTRVPNDDFGNLFGGTTPFGIDKDQSEYIALILENDTGSTVSNILFWFDFPENSYSNFEIGAVSVARDSNDVDIIERVENKYSRPYDPDFVKASGIANAVALGDLLDSQRLGIWIKRTILRDVIIADYNDRITKEGDVYIEVELGTSDSIDINLSWD